jgi:cell division protein FtsQ
MTLTNIPWKSILISTFWALIVIGFFVLWVFAVLQQDQLKCKQLKIKVDNNSMLDFVKETDVLQNLKLMGYNSLLEKPIHQLAYNVIEKNLERNPWTANAEIFTDQNGKINIEVKQRCPLIRIINKKGVSFYLDNKGNTMPTHTKFTPRVLLITGNVYYSDFNATNPENSFLKPLVEMCQFICNDEYWNAQIAQIEVKENKEFLISTLIGNQEIDFGTAEAYKDKLFRLKTFYTKGLNNIGWNKFKKITLKYNNQIVCI